VETDQENPYIPPQAELTGIQDLDTGTGEPRPLPFEDPDRYPTLWSRFKETVVQAIKENQTFLERVPLGEGTTRPWQFQMLSLIPVAALLVLVILPLVAIGTVGGLFGAGREKMVAGGVILGVAAGIVVIFPFLLFLGMYLMGGLDHFCLWIWGGTREGVGLEQTVRADGYAHGVFNLVSFPLQILGAIPFIGLLFGLANMGLSMVFMVFKGMALARMHRTDTWRGICAVFTPFLMLCCCGVLAAMAIPALLAARGH